MKDFMILLGAIVLFFALLGGFAYWWEVTACEKKWQRSGFGSEYGIIQGCVIKVNGRWIPEERYRDFDE